MALIRTAQEGRWILFTFILLFGNFLVPIVAIAFLLNKATQLARS
jgi:hypothetical protein